MYGGMLETAADGWMGGGREGFMVYIGMRFHAQRKSTAGHGRSIV